ncbi:SRPBCC family protein [Maricaulis sp.]|uniref:SRPBCC family protein n=1 Tax=Maricaulis sp. TaxID=1486257 RepID=UPI003A957B3A
MSETVRPKRAWIWVGVRLLLVFAKLVLLAGLFYALGGTDAGAGLAGGFTALFGLPFCLGAIIQFAISPDGKAKASRTGVIVGFLLLAVMVIVGVFFLEGLICMVFLAVPWWISAWLGALVVSGLHARFRQRAVLHSAGLIVLPFAMLLLGPLAANPTHHFEVRRSVVIAAAPDQIWPHLLALENLSDDEGVWTIAQNVLRIPRPRSALVVGEGVGAVRLARWGEHIGFEEHVTGWSQNDHLAWRFVFPDDSVARYTDAHIGPDSEFLGIETGSYTLTPLANGRTRLTLTTRYRATSPANHYSAVWGEIILGGIQRNILTVISDRSEAMAG